jgi:hypothetical protein
MRPCLSLRSLAVPATLALIAATLTVSLASPLSASPSGSHPIRPGTTVTISGITCTAGAILHQGRTVYVAIPASCAALPTSLGKVQNGCRQSALAPTGTPAKIGGAKHRGVLKYASFTRMQGSGHQTADGCHFNDLALIKLDPRDRARVSGALAGTHAPTAVRPQPPASGGHLELGNDSATAGASHQGGWVLDVTTNATLRAADVGSPAVRAGKVFGMLTVLPVSMVPMLPVNAVGGSPARVYSLHKALHFLHRVKGFRHVDLLRAGDRP